MPSCLDLLNEELKASIVLLCFPFLHIEITAFDDVVCVWYDVTTFVLEPNTDKW